VAVVDLAVAVVVAEATTVAVEATAVVPSISVAVEAMAVVPSTTTVVVEATAALASCQRRSDIAAAGRSKSAAVMRKQKGPLEGAFLLAARHS
jgi:hypothetical protein